MLVFIDMEYRHEILKIYRDFDNESGTYEWKIFEQVNLDDLEKK